MVCRTTTFDIADILFARSSITRRTVDQLTDTLGYDPVGWGLPYGNLVAKDTAKPLMEHAVQALLILLDYGHPIKLPGSGED